MKIKLFNDKLHCIVTSLVVVFVVSLTIGFSAFNTELKLILAGSVTPTDQQNKNADVNGDGVVDTSDQAALSEALSGVENYLPDYPYN